jgi:hypothetical protein
VWPEALGVLEVVALWAAVLVVAGVVVAGVDAEDEVVVLPGDEVGDDELVEVVVVRGSTYC